MQVKGGLRAVLTAFVSFSLALPLVGAAAVSAAHASGPSEEIVFSEINWAGTDQWIELYNTTAAPINVGDYQILVNGSVQVTLPVLTAIPAHHNYLISRMALGASPSLGGSVGTPDYVAPAMNLPAKDAQYTLETVATHQLVDRADDGAGAPMAGSDGTTGDMTVASMARVFPLADGSMASSWRTSHTIGSGFKLGVTQYGTPTDFVGLVDPADPNPELSAPSDVSVSPVSPAVLPVSPMVTGKAPALAQFVDVRFDLVGGNQYSEVSTFVLPDGTFAVSVGGIVMPGIYRITVYDKSFGGDRSASVIVPIPGSSQGEYVVNSPETGTVNAPTLNAYPTLVNTPKVTLTGSSDAGTLVVSLNGKDYESKQLAAGQTAFSLDVNLVPNTVNKIEVRAQDAAGHTSDPTVATVTHDNIAPVAVIRTLVVMHSRPNGTVDSVSGLNGVAEIGATVEAYSDAALTHKVGSAPVTTVGSFGEIGLGDDQVSTVYLVVRDPAGNMDPATAQAFSNSVAFGSNLNISLSFSNIGQNQATMTWGAVNGAANYRMKYKLSNGTYSSPMDLCVTGSGCILQRNLVNLTAGSTYTVAIAAVDQNGGESNYTEASFQTLAAPVVTTANANLLGVGGANPARVATGAASSAPSAASSSATSADTNSTATTPEATPSPSPSPTPEQGDVKSADTTSSHNYTPWIILGVLLLLALIATLAYFYWFGGEEEESPAPTAQPTASSGGVTTKVTTPADKNAATKQPDQEKPADREKRW